MMLDARTVAVMIRRTVETLKQKNPQWENEPAHSIIVAFNELASSFENITNARREEKAKEEKTNA